MDLLNLKFFCLFFSLIQVSISTSDHWHYYIDDEELSEGSGEILEDSIQTESTEIPVEIEVKVWSTANSNFGGDSNPESNTLRIEEIIAIAAASCIALVLLLMVVRMCLKRRSPENYEKHTNLSADSSTIAAGHFV